ncbi:uncharacterized protein [Lolium perenne]|uniref:uncharacterized protein n=1 Tax=Lolium perenne TaxID=4522 RepID=UPI003A98DE0A
MDRRTTLYNRAVTHYHKAKLDRADLARELGTAKVEAAKVPRLESDLRAARAQCAESEEAGRSSAAKLKLAEQELTRLRLLEQNHLSELNSLRTAEKEKVDDLSRRLTEVEKQRLALQEEVTAKSTELTATAKRWTDEIGALDRGLAAAFPETQDAALAAVGVARESRRQETGEGSSEYFSMEDHMASMAARVEPITKLGWELRKAVEELAPMLWPEEAVPQDISSLTSLMERAPDRFLDRKESATRAYADMALSFVLSCDGKSPGWNHWLDKVRTPSSGDDSLPPLDSAEEWQAVEEEAEEEGSEEATAAWAKEDADAKAKAKAQLATTVNDEEDTCSSDASTDTASSKETYQHAQQIPPKNPPLSALKQQCQSLANDCRWPPRRALARQLQAAGSSVALLRHTQPTASHPPQKIPRR